MIIEEDLNQGGKIDRLEKMLTKMAAKNDKVAPLLKDVAILKEINNTSPKQLKTNHVALKDAKKKLSKVINDYKLFAKFSRSGNAEDLKALGIVGAVSLLGQILGGPLVGGIMAAPVAVKMGMDADKGEKLQDTFKRVRGRTSFLREENYFPY